MTSASSSSCNNAEDSSVAAYRTTEKSMEMRSTSPSLVIRTGASSSGTDQHPKGNREDAAGIDHATEAASRPNEKPMASEGGGGGSTVMKKGRFIVNTAGGKEDKSPQQEAPAASTEPSVDPCEGGQPKVTRRGRFSVVDSLTGGGGSVSSVPTVMTHNGAGERAKPIREYSTDSVISQLDIDTSALEDLNRVKNLLCEEEARSSGNNHRTELSDHDGPNVASSSACASRRSSPASHRTGSDSPPLRVVEVDGNRTEPIIVHAEQPKGWKKKGRFIVENVQEGDSQLPESTPPPPNAPLIFHPPLNEVPIPSKPNGGADDASAITATTQVEGPCKRPASSVQITLGGRPPSPLLYAATEGPVGAVSISTSAATANSGSFGTEEARPGNDVGLPPAVNATGSATPAASAPVVIALDTMSAPLPTQAIIVPGPSNGMFAGTESTDHPAAKESAAPEGKSEPPSADNSPRSATEGFSSSSDAAGVTKKGRFVVINSQGQTLSGPVGLLSTTLGVTPVTLTSQGRPMGLITTPVSLMTIPGSSDQASPVSAASDSEPETSPQTGSDDAVNKDAPNLRTSPKATIMKVQGPLPNSGNSGGQNKVPMPTLQARPKAAGSRAMSAPGGGPKERIDIRSFDARRANGMGRVSYFLDQMRSEIDEVDSMNRSLQGHVRIFRDKNKELEGKNRDLEKKLVEERQLREQAEMKLKQAKKKMIEMKNELAALRNASSGSEKSLDVDTGKHEEHTDVSKDVVANQQKVSGDRQKGEIRRVSSKENVRKLKSTSGSGSCSGPATPKTKSAAPGASHRKTTSMVCSGLTEDLVSPRRRNQSCELPAQADKGDTNGTGACAGKVENPYSGEPEDRKPADRAVPVRNAKPPNQRPPLPTRAKSENPEPFQDLDQLARNLAKDPSNSIPESEPGETEDHASHSPLEQSFEEAPQRSGSICSVPDLEKAPSSATINYAPSNDSAVIIPGISVQPMMYFDPLQNGQSQQAMTQQTPMTQNGHFIQTNTNHQQMFHLDLNNVGASLGQSVNDSGSGLTLIAMNATSPEGVSQGYLVHQSSGSYSDENDANARKTFDIARFDPMSSSTADASMTQQLFVSSDLSTQNLDLLSDMSNGGSFLIMNSDDLNQMQISHQQQTLAAQNYFHHQREAESNGVAGMNEKSQGGVDMGMSMQADPFDEIARRSTLADNSVKNLNF